MMLGTCTAHDCETGFVLTVHKKPVCYGPRHFNCKLYIPYLSPSRQKCLIVIEGLSVVNVSNSHNSNYSLFILASCSKPE